MASAIDAESEEEVRIRKARCYKLMLEAGADVSLSRSLGGSGWISCFMRAVWMSSSVNTTQLSGFNVH
jgi:hypothetical protein